MKPVFLFVAMLGKSGIEVFRLRYNKKSPQNILFSLSNIYVNVRYEGLKWRFRPFGQILFNSGQTVDAADYPI